MQALRPIVPVGKGHEQALADFCLLDAALKRVVMA
jgi:hypothetical protein